MKEKILVISGSELGNGVGEQFLSSMIKSYPKDLITRYVLSSKINNGERLHAGIKTIVKKIEQNSLPILSSINHNKFEKKILPFFVDEITKIIEEDRISTIWIILNSDQLILLGAHLYPLNAKIICQVWDTPEYLCEASRLSSSIKKNVFQAFNKVMQHSSHIVCISEYMANVYGSKYQKNTSVMYFISNEPFQPRMGQPIDKNKPIKVIFAGSLYAWKEWNTFIGAIEKFNNLNNQKFEVTIIGTPSRWTRIPKWVKKYDHLPSKEALRKVSEADLAYLPYWMDKKHAETVKMAFPSKLVFYCTAGTPIFYHGPQNSSPTNFIQQNNIGVTCDTYDKEIIINKLEELVSNSFNKRYNDNIYRTYVNHFEKDKSSNIFNEIIECQT